MPGLHQPAAGPQPLVSVSHVGQHLSVGGRFLLLRLCNSISRPDSDTSTLTSKLHHHPHAEHRLPVPQVGEPHITRAAACHIRRR